MAARTPYFYQTRCPHCGTTSLWQVESMLARLRQQGKLRREKDPQAELVVELFGDAAGSLACAACGQRGLHLEPYAPRFAADAWGLGRVCQGCGQTIPPERLQAMPDAEYCAGCQQQHEAVPDSGPTAYCPRCGAPQAVRVRHTGGRTQYQAHCPQCGKVDGA